MRTRLRECANVPFVRIPLGVCAGVCVHIFRVYAYVSRYVGGYARANVYTCACVGCTYSGMCMCSAMCVRTSVGEYTVTYVHVDSVACLCVWLAAYVGTYTCTVEYIYIGTYIRGSVCMY